MKIFKRLRLIFLLFLGCLMVIPAFPWWIFTGKDILTQYMDYIIIKYWDDEN